MGIHIKNGIFCRSNLMEFPFLLFQHFFLSVSPEISMVLDFVVGFCDVKHATEELDKDTLRLPRSCWNEFSWDLHGFFLLSVHSMTLVKLWFSLSLLFQVDTEFCPNSYRWNTSFYLSAVLTTASSSCSYVLRKIHCSFWSTQTSNSVIHIYLPALKERELLFMSCFCHANSFSRTFMFLIVGVKFLCHINNLVWQMD